MHATINEFFHAPAKMRSAEQYVYMRSSDAAKLRGEMKFKLYSSGLSCEIYGHYVRLALRDDGLHQNQRAGAGDIHIAGEPAGTYHRFDDIDQVLAFILRTNW